MQTGWVDENQYHTDANGEMMIGWQRLDPPADADYSQDSDEDYDPFALADNEANIGITLSPMARSLPLRKTEGKTAWCALTRIITA